jgi:hypothetical protein
MALRCTQPLTEINIMNLLGVKALPALATVNLITICMPIV